MRPRTGADSRRAISRLATGNFFGRIFFAEPGGKKSAALFLCRGEDPALFCVLGKNSTSFCKIGARIFRSTSLSGGGGLRDRRPPGGRISPSALVCASADRACQLFETLVCTTFVWTVCMRALYSTSWAGQETPDRTPHHYFSSLGNQRDLRI